MYIATIMMHLNCMLCSIVCQFLEYDTFMYAIIILCDFSIIASDSHTKLDSEEHDMIQKIKRVRGQINLDMEKTQNQNEKLESEVQLRAIQKEKLELEKNHKELKLKYLHLEEKCKELESDVEMFEQKCKLLLSKYNFI